MPNPNNSDIQAYVNSIPCEYTRRALSAMIRQSASFGSITALTAATGTASNTIADVGSSFSQTTLNDNLKSLAEKINTILTLLDYSGLSDT